MFASDEIIQIAHKYARWVAYILFVPIVGVLAYKGHDQYTNNAAAYEMLDKRAIFSTGDVSRLARVFAKARRGETITVGVIGGSITEGIAASKRTKSYAYLVVKWWRETFPAVKVEFVNAGIGSTGSDYGSLRVQRDLLSHKPDFVIVEYAINETNSQNSSETLEGVLRQVMKQKNQPAVVLLFMMHINGANAQEWFAKVGMHYGLPMISYRDALWPEIEAGRMNWTDISPDSIHPNNRGHALAARWINRLLKHALDQQVAEVSPTAMPALPPPLFTDLFEYTELREADDLKPVGNNGWTYDERVHGWKTEQPGSIIEFDISGRVLFSSHVVSKGSMGRTRVTVDNGNPITLEGWFNQTWDYLEITTIGKDLSPGQHRVRFQLLADKSDGSTGTAFYIMGLGAAAGTTNPSGNDDT